MTDPRKSGNDDQEGLRANWPLIIAGALFAIAILSFVMMGGITIQDSLNHQAVQQKR
jgi:hypothetical protein